jgi:hypothetical protein
MLEGICPECGSHYHGPALHYQRNQICFKCGGILEVRNNGTVVRTACAQLKISEYKADADIEEWDDLCTKNLLFYITMN